MHELSVTGREPDVGGSGGHGREEDEITRSQPVQIDRGAGLVLIRGTPWKVDTVPGKHVPRKPAAVESFEGFSAVSIRATSEIEGGRDNRVGFRDGRRGTGGRSRRFRRRVGEGPRDRAAAGGTSGSDRSDEAQCCDPFPIYESCHLSVLSVVMSWLILILVRLSVTICWAACYEDSPA